MSQMLLMIRWASGIAPQWLIIDCSAVIYTVIVLTSLRCGVVLCLTLWTGSLSDLLCAAIYILHLVLRWLIVGWASIWMLGISSYLRHGPCNRLKVSLAVVARNNLVRLISWDWAWIGHMLAEGVRNSVCLSGKIGGPNSSFGTSMASL